MLRAVPEQDVKDFTGRVTIDIVEEIVTLGLDGFTPANWHHGLCDIDILEHHPVAVIVVEERVATMVKRGFSS